jgi:hypothetical protein
MEKFIDVSAGGVVVSEAELQSRLPLVVPAKSISDTDLVNLGFARLTIHDPEPCDPDTQVRLVPVIEKDLDGTWHQRTKTRDKTAQELAAEEAAALAAVLSAIRDEAERRLRAGVLVDGSPFMADDGSTLRLEQAITGLTSGIRSSVKFTTAAGAVIEVSDAAVLQSLLVVVLGYRADVLAASTELQADPPADPALDDHWPARPSVSLSA